MIDLIYCAAGNKVLAEIAIGAGWLYGGRLPDPVYFQPYFADQEYEAPNRTGYMSALEHYRPNIATVIDWEEPDQLPNVLSWAEEAAQWVQETVVIIPKVHGGVRQLPRRIGGKTVRLGYSVPTSYGGTEVQAWEFTGWGVHLLGGSPHEQMRLTQYFNVESADTNYHMKLANEHCQFWQPGTARYAANRFFPQLVEAEGEKWNGGGKKSGANIEAFRRSSIAIAQAWRGEPVTLWGMDQPLRKSVKKVVEIPNNQLPLFDYR